MMTRVWVDQDLWSIFYVKINRFPSLGSFNSQFRVTSWHQNTKYYYSLWKFIFFFDFSLPVATNDPKLGNSWFSSFLWSHHGFLHYFQSNDLSKYRTFALNKIIFLIFLISRSVSIIFLTESTHNRQKTEFFKVFLTEYPWENMISAQYFATKIPLCSIHIVYHPLQERHHIFKRAWEAPNTRAGGKNFFSVCFFGFLISRDLRQFEILGQR